MTYYLHTILNITENSSITSHMYKQPCLIVAYRGVDRIGGWGIEEGPALFLALSSHDCVSLELKQRKISINQQC